MNIPLTPKFLVSNIVYILIIFFLKELKIVASSSLQFLSATSKFVRERAERELSVAITAYDQTQVSRSLQTFFNMDCLPEAVDSVLRSVSKV